MEGRRHRIGKDHDKWVSYRHGQATASLPAESSPSWTVSHKWRECLQAITQDNRHPQMLKTKQKVQREQHTGQSILSSQHCCSVNASANSMRKKKTMGQCWILIHKDAKIFNKMLTTWVPQHMTKTTHHGQRGFSLGMQEWTRTSQSIGEAHHIKGHGNMRPSP